jgi:GntR family transcriptional regulator
MKKKGIDVETFQCTAKLAPVSVSVGQALQLEPGTMAVRLDRLRGWSGEPVIHSRSWLHPRLGLTVDADFTRPLYELIESQCAVIVEHAREEIEAVAAPAPIATLLQIAKGRPVLLRRHTVFDPGDRPIEHAEVHYRSDRFTLTLDIRKESK